MTAIETITNEQIEALQAEASAAGDGAMVRICKWALLPPTRYERGMDARIQTSREACVKAIREAELAS